MTKQTVIHRTSEGDWMPCPGGLVRVLGGKPTMIGTPLADYPHDSLDWEVVDLDQPEEGYWAVWRCSRWGEVAEVGQYLSRRQAQAVADELTAGPDGVAVGGKVAVYRVVRR
jgi:hypothetical protein